MTELMHKHMATLFRNSGQCPNPPEAPYQFSVAQSPIEGRCTVHKAAISDTAPCASPQNCATGLGATRPPPRPGSSLPLFCPPISKRGEFSRPQGSHWHAHRRPSPQNHATQLGATRPSPPTPTPRERPCRNSVAQSPIEGRWHVRKAAAVDAAPRPSPPLATELRHAAGRNPPNPTGSALLRFHRSICKRGALPRPQSGPSRLLAPSPPLNRRAHRALATRARRYLLEELAVLWIAVSLPTVLVLLPSHLDVAVRSSCRFGGERWPWLLRA